MQIIDTHTHIFTEEFDDDRDAVVSRAREAGVVRCLLPNLDDESIKALHESCDRYSDLCLPMMGLHPSYVEGAGYKDKLSKVERALRQDPDRYVAIGEIGLDYHWDTTYKEEMNVALRTQLEWAAEFSKPVSLHTRDAVYDTIKAIREVGEDSLRGVFHSFTGSREELEAILELPHFMVGINGVVTFKNSGLKQFLPDVLPLERVVVETDAPYLAPTPHRGKRNEPSFVVQMITRLAELYDDSRESVGEQIFVNSTEMFNLARH